MGGVMQAAERCKRHRRRILDLSQQLSALHIAPAFSCIEIIDALYHDVMRPQDTFILSKGHAGVAQYVVLEELGLITTSDMDTFCRGGAIGTHPDRGGPIACSTGSLGHGLGMAVGMALADRSKGEDRNIYVLLGDGEMQEGSVWEAMRMASELKLDKLCALVDCNGYAGLDRIDNSPLLQRAKAFGWQAMAIDGHDNDTIAIAAPLLPLRKPQMLICHTVKGNGVSYMIDAPIWHYRSPDAQLYQQALSELG